MFQVMKSHNNIIKQPTPSDPPKGENATKIAAKIARVKADFQSSHEAPRSSLRVLASN
jgi:hypothetical protein